MIRTGSEIELREAQSSVVRKQYIYKTKDSGLVIIQILGKG